MSAVIVSGEGSGPLAAAVRAEVGCPPVSCEVRRFPDGELRPIIDNLRGDDVYVVQSTGPPVGEHVVELLLLLDACRRGGAARITAVVPYFGYARQDRRDASGESVGARVMLDAIVSAGADWLVVVDPHTVALEAMCDVPMEMLTAVPVLVDALHDSLQRTSGGRGTGEELVVVAPDLGAAKLAERYAAALGCQVAVVRKSRRSGSEVRLTGVVGDVEVRRAVIVDDMISTGGTVEAAARALAHGGATLEAVVATHGLLVDAAVDRLAKAEVPRVITTDSVVRGLRSGLEVQTCSIAGLLADAIGRLHRGEDLAELHVTT